MTSSRSSLAPALAVAFLLITPCGCSSPTEPSHCLRLGGTWRVDFTNSCGAAWSETISVTQTGCHYSGVAQVVPFAFEGDISGNSATIRVMYSSPCAGTAEGTGTITVDAFSGSFHGQVTGGTACCPGTSSGSFIFFIPVGA